MIYSSYGEVWFVHLLSHYGTKLVLANVFSLCDLSGIILPVKDRPLQLADEWRFYFNSIIVTNLSLKTLFLAHDTSGFLGHLWLSRNDVLHGNDITLPPILRVARKAGLSGWNRVHFNAWEPMFCNENAQNFVQKPVLTLVPCRWKSLRGETGSGPTEPHWACVSVCVCCECVYTCMYMYAYMCACPWKCVCVCVYVWVGVDESACAVCISVY